jgi:N utilization substance protein B
MVGTRRQARTVALEALYEIDCAGHAVTAVLGERARTGVVAEDVRLFVYELVTGVINNRTKLDDLIQRYAPEWPVNQMAIIDRNVLRMAIFEIMISSSAPLRVVINEAVELAKLYGSDTSPRFVNGVLGSLVAAEVALDGAGAGSDEGASES